ncbi:hypothetical protein [Nonomuraea sp. NPDC005650]|uniref:hypothetical protein n=1 Tax=Nonomuraea sp. NPDC005650 TaxID=3157045 RepID=UPI0033BEDF2B
MLTAALSAASTVVTLSLAPTAQAADPGRPPAAKAQHQVQPGERTAIVYYRLRSRTRMVSTGNGCTEHPKTTCDLVSTLDKGTMIEPFCQQPGDTIGTNTWWTLGYGPANTYGFVPNWDLDYPHNKLPNVPRCVG